MATARKTTNRTKIQHEPSALAQASTKASSVANAEDVEVDEEDEMVLVVIPKTFILTSNDHQPIRYEAGTRKMPLSHAEHWYAKAMGVTLVDE